MSVNIESITLTPSEVTVGGRYIISVKVQVSTYERLKVWTHKLLMKFTHKNLAEDLLK